MNTSISGTPLAEELRAVLIDPELFITASAGGGRWWLTIEAPREKIYAVQDAVVRVRQEARQHRPAVALALQSKDDSAALEIARLRAALEPFGKPAYRFGRVLRENGGELPDDNDLADDPPSGIYIGDLRKARAALQTDGGK